MKKRLKSLSIMLFVIVFLFCMNANTYAAVANEIRKNTTDEVNSLDTNKTEENVNDDNNNEESNVDGNTTTDKNTSNKVENEVSDNTTTEKTEEIIAKPESTESTESTIENNSNATLNTNNEELNSNNQEEKSIEINTQRTKQDGIYKIAIGKSPNKTIEVAGSNTMDNATVGIWDYGNATAQKFYFQYQNEGFYKITAMHTGKSLTAKNGKIEEGTNIVQYTYKGLESQKWILRDSNKNGWVISPLSNPELSISICGNIINGSKMILSKTEDNDNQMFWISNISEEQRTKADGTYKIAVGKDSSKSIETTNTTIEINKYGNKISQKLKLQYIEGYYKITAMHTGKSLTVKDNEIKEGNEIVQLTYQGLDSQKWVLRDTTVNGWVISPLSNLELLISIKGNIVNGSKMILSKAEDNDNQMFWIFNISQEQKTKQDGLYKIAVGADSNKTMEVAGSDTANNAQIGIWDYGNVAAQKFYFEYQKEGFYKITAKHTGKSLTVKNNELVSGTQIVQYDYQGLDSQKWILRDSGKNGWIISLLSNPELSISIEGSIVNGSKMILSKTEDNNNQMFYLYLAQITIVINPGHGGSDIGCANGNLAEKNVTLNIARKIQNNLSRYEDVNVILTRTGDYDIDLASRAMIARNNNANLYISLHINDEANHKATGSQMYVPFYEGTKHYNSNMTRLANLIQDKLGAIGIRENLSGGTTKRNIDQIPKYQYLMDGQVVQADYYADIRHAMKGDTLDYGPDLNTNTGVPAILVEHCFMNSSDIQFLDSDYDLQRIADADSSAIIEYFNL